MSTLADFLSDDIGLEVDNYDEQLSCSLTRSTVHWTDGTVMVETDIGYMHSTKMEWMNLTAPFDIVKGDMFTLDTDTTGNARLIIMDVSEEHGYLVKLFSTSPGERIDIILKKKSTIQHVNEPLPLLPPLPHLPPLPLRPLEMYLVFP